MPFFLFDGELIESGRGRERGAEGRGKEEQERLTRVGCRREGQVENLKKTRE